MIKVMFVCLGNICRSPMAEFVFKDMVKKEKLEDKFVIQSAATSIWEIGSPVHHGTAKKLAEFNISVKGKSAVQLEKSDYEKYDYIIGMERNNVTDILRIVGADIQNKVSRLLDFTDNPRDIADPWYTGDFDTTYNDVKEGCEALLKKLKNDL